METTDLRPRYLRLRVAAAGVIVVVLICAAWIEYSDRPAAVTTEETAADRRAAITEAFDGVTVDSSVAEIKEINAVFATVRAALAKQDLDEVARHFDEDLLMSAIERQGGVIPASGRTDWSALSTEEGLWPSQDFRLKNLRFTGGRTEAIVYLQHFTDDGQTSKERWWLSKQSGVWRIHDIENLSTCWRLSSFFAVILSRPELKEEIGRKYLHLVAANRLRRKERYDLMRDRLQTIRFSREFPYLEATRRYLLGVAHMGEYNLAAAIAQLDSALDINPDFPAAHIALAGSLLLQHEPEEALTHTRKYMEILGPDVEVYVLSSEVCLALNRSREAENYARLALKENRMSTNAIAALAKALPDDRKQEVADALDPAIPRDDFRALVSRLYAKEEEEPEAVMVLMDAYLRLQPQDGEALETREALRLQFFNKAILDYARALKAERNPTAAEDKHPIELSSRSLYGRVWSPEELDPVQGTTMENFRRAAAFYERFVAGSEAAEASEAANQFPFFCIEHAKFLARSGQSAEAHGPLDMARQVWERTGRQDPEREASHGRNIAKVYHSIGWIENDEGRFSQVVAAWRKALETRHRIAVEDPSDEQNQQEIASTSNSLAWILATCPNGSVRNGDQAVRLATRACELTGWVKPHHLGTLAAASAEAGDFAAAVKWQSDALMFLGTSDERAGFRSRLELYQAKKPYREEPQTGEASSDEAASPPDHPPAGKPEEGTRIDAPSAGALQGEETARRGA